jgi:hypothetical protein
MIRNILQDPGLTTEHTENNLNICRKPSVTSSLCPFYYHRLLFFYNLNRENTEHFIDK